MAAQRVIITLECTDCRERNYSTTKNKRANAEKLELSKFCWRCRKHTESQGNEVEERLFGSSDMTV